MKNSLTTEIAVALIADLQAFEGVCEEVLSLAMREYQALSGRTEYQHLEFYERRKRLLPDIESSVSKFRDHRMTWQQIPSSQQECFKEARPLFQRIQSLLTRIMVLDRENQQAMLRRGLVPVKHLPGIAVQQPHYVADLYRRNSAT